MSLARGFGFNPIGRFDPRRVNFDQAHFSLTWSRERRAGGFAIRAIPALTGDGS